MTLTAVETSGVQVIGTEAGFDRVAASPQLLELLGQFYVTDTKPEACFADTPIIGAGYNSEVREVGGMAVKLSTPTTGRRAWHWGPANQKIY